MLESVRAVVRTLVVRVAMVVESLLQAGVLLVLRVRGRHLPMIVPFIGHGSTRRVRVGGRVVLGRPEAAAPAVGVPEAPEPTLRSRRAVLRATIARFLTVEVPGAVVRVSGPGVDAQVRADRDGYVDAVLDVSGDALAPGWHEFALRLDDEAEASAQVLVVDPETRVGVVSDVDDTILETGLTRGIEFLRATLLTPVRDRTPLTGAAALYRAFTAPVDGVTRPIFYVSTSPWNLHEMLLEFIAIRRFPLGPLLLTDWGPSRSGLFRIGAQEHKVGLVERMLQEHPQLGLVLVGDSGQHDPEIYATLARAHPDRIRAVYIRRTRHALPGRIAAVDALAAEITAAGVPMLAVDDSLQIAAHAADLGLLDASALAEVRAD
ncbi:App1 family protein [Pseudonocardia sichuanensis]|uniref:Phosphatidate phosphatase APP1 n=1 Tax=Pseudonocardia kunmingensis TaxID=630975 RepID=A0A543DK96_9PSEU|nr:phosphatase domain-containing protein [Pseudonocardia kunmingensis]TQM09750.1 phosphatidate phosphatase APP1 [Pseudonocardia kunmingensis]